MVETWRWASAAGGIFLSLALTAEGGTATPPATFNVRFGRDHVTAGAVQLALDGVAQRLGSERCQQVFSDFRDAHGLPLVNALEALGQTSQSYLGLLLFYDGSARPLCAVKGNLAVAQPGGRAVFICPETFRKWQLKYPALAEAILIHEVLHTLGLGENPPSSREITAQVLRRCRR